MINVKSSCHQSKSCQGIHTGKANTTGEGQFHHIIVDDRISDLIGLAAVTIGYRQLTGKERRLQKALSIDRLHFRHTVGNAAIGFQVCPLRGAICAGGSGTDLRPGLAIILRRLQQKLCLCQFLSCTIHFLHGDLTGNGRIGTLHSRIGIDCHRIGSIITHIAIGSSNLLVGVLAGHQIGECGLTVGIRRSICHLISITVIEAVHSTLQVCSVIRCGLIGLQAHCAGLDLEISRHGVLHTGRVSDDILQAVLVDAPHTIAPNNCTGTSGIGLAAGNSNGTVNGLRRRNRQCVTASGKADCGIVALEVIARQNLIGIRHRSGILAAVPGQLDGIGFRGRCRTETGSGAMGLHRRDDGVIVTLNLTAQGMG